MIQCTTKITHCQVRYKLKSEGTIFSINVEGQKSSSKHPFTSSRFTMVRAPTLVLLAVGLLAANSLSQEGNMNNEEKDNVMVSGILLDISLDDQKRGFETSRST